MVLLLTGCDASTQDPFEGFPVDNAVDSADTAATGTDAVTDTRLPHVVNPPPHTCRTLGLHEWDDVVEVDVGENFVWTGIGCGKLEDVGCALDAVDFIVTTDANVETSPEQVTVSILPHYAPAGGGVGCWMTWSDAADRFEQWTTVLIPVTW